MRIRVLHGDCLRVMRLMRARGVQVDSVVTDPPYHLHSIVRRFGKAGSAPAKDRDGLYKRASTGFMGQTWDGGDIAMNPDTWALVYDLLKPGGHMIALCGTRTEHRVACAIEDAGFEVRDRVLWLYGSGFPKSHDVAKAIDKAAGHIGHNIIELKHRLIALVDASGKTRTQIDAECGFRATNYLTLPAEGKRPDPWINCLPSRDKWLRMKEVLGGNDELDAIFSHAEREVIGTKRAAPGVAFTSEGPTSLDVTAPATDVARQWEGWGTALKPATEIGVWAQKPFDAVPLNGTPDAYSPEIEAFLWSIAPAKFVERCSELSPDVSGEATCAGVQWIAAALHTAQSVDPSELTDMFNSPEEASTFLSIAMLWNGILAEVSANQSTFTTETATSLTTGLKTLRCWTSRIIPEGTIQAAATTPGWWSLASSVGQSLNGSDASSNGIRKRSARASASSTIASAVHDTLASIAEVSFGTDRVKVDHSAAPLAITHIVQGIGDTIPEHTGLSPSVDIGVLARKPLSEKSIAANVVVHGTGALNIDGCRVQTEESTVRARSRAYGRLHEGRQKQGGKPGVGGSDVGRWPANIFHDGSDEVLEAFPEAPGQQRPSSDTERSRANVYGATSDNGKDYQPRADTGTAARFFYSSKADAADRLGSKHPTVKPVDLMAYLCRLITPPDGLVLDPFAGSGTTGMACLREGFRCVLIEREAEYIADIHRRLKHVRGEDTPLFSGTPPPKRQPGRKIYGVFADEKSDRSG